jgi:hypothetical protein
LCITLGMTGVFGFCPSYGIIKHISETGPIFRPQVRDTRILLDPLEEANLSGQVI